MSAAEAEQAYRKAAEEYMRQSQPKSEDEEYEKAMADYYANGDNETVQNTKADEWDDIPFQSAYVSMRNELEGECELRPLVHKRLNTRIILIYLLRQHIIISP